MWLETSGKWIFASQPDHTGPACLVQQDQPSIPAEDTWVPSKAGTDARCICFLAGCFSNTLIDFLIFFSCWWPHIGGCKSLDTESNTRWTQALQRNPYPILMKQHWDSQAVTRPRLETKAKKLLRGSKLKPEVPPYLQPGLFYSVCIMNSLNPTLPPAALSAAQGKHEFSSLLHILFVPSPAGHCNKKAQQREQRPAGSSQVTPALDSCSFGMGFSVYPTTAPFSPL